MKYARIIIDISHQKLDRSFDYVIPPRLEDEIQVGTVVRLPFGNGNRTVEGFVVEISEQSHVPQDRLKEVLGVSPNSNGLESQLIALASWMKQKYGCTLLQALKVALPARKKVREAEHVRLALKQDEGRTRQALEECRRKKHEAKVRLLEALLTQGELPLSEARERLGVGASTVDALVRDGMVERKRERKYRNPYETLPPHRQITLNESQQTVVEEIWKEGEGERPRPFLLHGVTGSGKTEVYVELARRMLDQGRQTILLVPEISLTYQTVSRFMECFGDKVSVLHSRLSSGERQDQMQRAREGEIGIMIGPRSALFTPFTNLGFIIIDEEHETSYKSEVSPKYDAREVALERARLCGALVLFGSATPSLTSYYRARRGAYRLLEMKTRAREQRLPNVFVEDLRQELREGNRSILSRRLRELMAQRLERGEQVMLFLNRRGYAGFVSCRSCGLVITCPHCDVSLSLHGNGRLICHYCGYETKAPRQCPECGSSYVGGFRAGTQQIEALVKKEFPQARVIRMDADTTRGKNGHESIVKRFAEGEAQIMVGTQMIVKGHDFPNVTLVGILAADLSLNGPSYEGCERTFQLLVQAAGRAGRGDRPGDVVIQTYRPDHYCIQNAARQDYESFYEMELRFRRVMGYPPVGKLLEFYLISPSEELLGKITEYVRLQLEAAAIPGIRVIGPAPAVIYKLQDRYRQVFYFKCEEEGLLIRLREYLEKVVRHFTEKYDCAVEIQFDVT